MPAGSSHVSFAELQRAIRLDAALLWALLHQAACTLRHLLNKGGCALSVGHPLYGTAAAPCSVLS